MTVFKEKVLYKKKKSDEVAIDLSNVSKKYMVTHEKPTLVEDVNRMLRFQKREEYWALKDVNLKIYKGEKIGFFGANGAGKTTLLKIIAGISSPTTGAVKTKGRIISLIDLAAGFHPDLTGQENIFLNGLIVGMSKQEIKSRFGQIIDFAGLGDFITAPLYTYSNGMKLRLGFSIAIHAKPKILLLDEVMNTGDEDFQKKSMRAIEEMFNNDVTLILVSHFIEHLKKYCDRLIEVSK
jgi:ABC-2 type transport system ATP-binding protein